MPSKSYTETRYPLIAALATLMRHGFNDFAHRGQCVDCLNGDGSYIRLHVGDTQGTPLEDHTLPNGDWRYPVTDLFVIAHEFLPEYINLKEV